MLCDANYPKVDMEADLTTRPGRGIMVESKSTWVVVVGYPSHVIIMILDGCVIKRTLPTRGEHGSTTHLNLGGHILEFIVFMSFTLLICYLYKPDRFA